MSTLQLTDNGLQASLNADAGGVLINPRTFKIGTSNVPFNSSQTDIQGSTIYAGNIRFVEVLSEQTVRFTLDVPSEVGGPLGVEIFEVAVYLEGNIMFGRCVLDQTIPKKEGAAYRITVLLTTSACDLTVLNVTIGDYTSVPSTPYMYTLPNPVDSQFNLINVLSSTVNLDGSTGPVLAMRYGAGGEFWAFTGYDRVFGGTPDSNNLTTSTFKRSSVTDSMNFTDGETIFVQIVSGAGAGETRRFTFNQGLVLFEEQDGEPFSALSDTSFITMWKKQAGGSGGGPSGACPWPPEGQGIPTNWVLTRGVTCPVWSPPGTAGGAVTLYTPPSKFKPVVLTQISNGIDQEFMFAGIDVENHVNTMVSLQGAVQHKTSYDFNGNKLSFSEVVPPNIGMDIRLFSKEASTGSRLVMKTDTVVADGNTRRFHVSQAVLGPEYCLVWHGGVFQHITSYTYDSATQEVVFTEAPKPGKEVEITTFFNESLGGYSTRVSVAQFRTTAPTETLQLPIAPESKDHTIVSISGLHLHRSRYSLVNDRILMLDLQRAGLDIEVTIFTNVQSEGTENTSLNGILVDGMITPRALRLYRHGMRPLELPLPEILLRGTKGIKVRGKYPVYTIEAELAESLTKESIGRSSVFRVQENTEEIIYTHRFQFQKDTVIMVTADFSAILGPGFSVNTGLERFEYVVGIRGPSIKEPDYGRRIQGTGVSGFAYVDTSVNAKAFSNASMTQTFSLIKQNNPAGYVDIVVRGKVFNADISNYGSVLQVGFNLLNLPLLEL